MPPTAPTPTRGSSPVPIEDVDSMASFQARTMDVPDALPDVWLVKVPSFVRDAWMAAGAQGGEELGKLTVRKIEGAREPEISITLPDTSTAPTTARHYANLPRGYKLRLATRYEGGNFVRKENTFLWKEDANGAPHSVVGKIVFEGTVNPDVTPSGGDARAYDNLLRARADKAARPLRTTKQADERATARAQWTGASSTVKKSVFGSNKLRDKRRALNEASRPRAERSSFLAALIALFRQRPQWTLAELQVHTGQNGMYTREVMQEIGEPLIRNDVRGLWQLKGGFLDVAQADGTDAMNDFDEVEVAPPVNRNPHSASSGARAPFQPAAASGAPGSSGQDAAPSGAGLSIAELAALDPAVLEALAGQVLGAAQAQGGQMGQPNDDGSIELSDEEDGQNEGSSSGVWYGNAVGQIPQNFPASDGTMQEDEEMDDDDADGEDGDGDGFEDSEFGFI